MPVFRTIDFHVAGQGLRLVVDGWPEPKGRTMADRLRAARSRHDRHRRLLLDEPRGHEGMTGAIITPPEHASSRAGVLFMHGDGPGHGWMDLCGHGVLAVGRHLARGEAPFVLDTVAGPVTVTAHGATVAAVLPAARVRAPAVPVALGTRAVAVDVAEAGGRAYAIVDGEAAGVPLVEGRRLELMRVAAAIVRALTAAKAASSLEAVVFTGPASSEGADLRAITFYDGGAMDRSPGGMAVTALLSVIDAMGLSDLSRPFVVEGPRGAVITARIHARVEVDGAPAIVPEIRAEAFMTGESTWHADA